MSLPESVAASLAIPLLFHRRRGDMAEVIQEVVACFERCGVDWCLVGAHAVGHYTVPRTTGDFDFVFDDRKWKRLQKELDLAFPGVAVSDIGVAYRLLSVDVDLIRGTSGPLFGAALADARVDEGWRVPPVENLVALKFLSALSQWRAPEKRIQDAADLAALYRAHRESIDRTKMIALASRVYPGAERAFELLLDRVDNGLPISI